MSVGGLLTVSKQAEKVALTHRQGRSTFHAAFKELREKHELSEDVALAHLFPPLEEGGGERIG